MSQGWGRGGQGIGEHEWMDGWMVGREDRRSQEGPPPRSVQWAKASSPFSCLGRAAMALRSQLYPEEGQGWARHRVLPAAPFPSVQPQLT